MESTEAVTNYVTARNRLCEAALPLFGSPSGLQGSKPEQRGEAAEDGRRSSRDLGRGVGIVMHRLLEHWPSDDAAALRRSLEQKCNDVGRVEAIEITPLLAECNEMLDQFLNSELKTRLDGIAPLGRELALLMRQSDGTVIRGSIDLLYRDDDGATVVADYKTDRTTDPAELCSRYGNQLRLYADGVMQALKLDHAPRAELWILRTGERALIEPND